MKLLLQPKGVLAALVLLIFPAFYSPFAHASPSVLSVGIFSCLLTVINTYSYSSLVITFDSLYCRNGMLLNLGTYLC